MPGVRAGIGSDRDSLMRMRMEQGAWLSREGHGAASGHNLNGTARVSKRMFGSRAGELSIDLRRSVIWAYGGKNSNIRLLRCAALWFGPAPKSCQKTRSLSVVIQA
jgi:hypothetical protein